MVDLFPNTTILVRATAIRIDTSTPIAPGITLLEQRGLGILGEPEQDRKVRVKHHNEIWGPLGRNLAEDVIFVETVSKRIAAKHPSGDYSLGMKGSRPRTMKLCAPIIESGDA